MYRQTEREREREREGNVIEHTAAINPSILGISLSVSSTKFLQSTVSLWSNKRRSRKMKDNNKIQSLKTISIRDINIKSEKKRERERESKCFRKINYIIKS